MARSPRASAAYSPISATAVLPDPVGAETTTERPSSSARIASSWKPSSSYGKHCGSRSNSDSPAATPARSRWTSSPGGNGGARGGCGGDATAAAAQQRGMVVRGDTNRSSRGEARVARGTAVRGKEARGSRGASSAGSSSVQSSMAGKQQTRRAARRCFVGICRSLHVN